MRSKIFLLLVGVCLLLPPCAGALERFDIISTRQLQELLTARKAGTVDFILVNSLDEVIYRDAHIPGSVNIPLARVDELIDRLGVDRNKLIIPY